MDTFPEKFGNSEPILIVILYARLRNSLPPRSTAIPSTKSQEAHTGVKFLEDQVDIVKMMLSIGVPLPREALKRNNTLNAAIEDTSIQMTNNVRVYAIADKYDIPGLKELAKSKFWILVASAELILNHPSIIYEIYNTTPSTDRGLRDIVTRDSPPQRLEYRCNDARIIDATFDLLRASAAILQATKESLQATKKSLQVAKECLQVTEEGLQATMESLQAPR
ncbi:hypothetical protein MMC22_003278 [Lobaria immixta]|nr:hypothetical protein [Lobaria immixta]